MEGRRRCRRPSLLAAAVSFEFLTTRLARAFRQQRRKARRMGSLDLNRWRRETIGHDLWACRRMAAC
ncbi:hypothetical protein IE4771_CH02684 [Rhizobium etli bv. mimosae str. IE4771]|uniref:Uncharacterized protein n=1 Tax=Rhizobium etli bv. mimosae str. IE4771 TaxID=1432050 RepID=A0A060I241_RHIET|nr:hypothetical protein IE4771_CH02684 [Rhizobium sp. IE4771]